MHPYDRLPTPPTERAESGLSSNKVKKETWKLEVHKRLEVFHLFLTFLRRPIAKCDFRSILRSPGMVRDGLIPFGLEFVKRQADVSVTRMGITNGCVVLDVILCAPSRATSSRNLNLRDLCRPCES